MAFGANSTNPRERRAYAHAKLAHIKEAGYAGKQSVSDALDEALQAVVAASGTQKGKMSGFVGRLAKEAVVVGDLAGDSPETVKLWGPRTNWSGRTPRLDGYYTDGINHEVLDIQGSTAQEPTEVWENGGVLHANADWEDELPSLVLAQPRMSNLAIAEALSRHFQAAVTDPAQIVQLV
jgi:hypothetical protein